MLSLADGQTLDLAGSTGGGNLPDEVYVGIRAEAISVSSNGSGVRAKVHFTEELGSSRLLHTEVGSIQIIVTSKDDGTIEPGAEVNLDLAPRALHFFDPSNGRRLSS